MTNAKINAHDDWEIIDAAYANLMATQGLDEEHVTDPYLLSDYDLDDAIAETERSMGYVPFPTITMLEAFARNGYLDDDQIWDEINEAVTRALSARAGELFNDAREQLELEEEESNFRDDSDSLDW